MICVIADTHYPHLCFRLVEMNLEHTASLSGAVTALRQDEKTRLDDAIAKSRAEEEVHVTV